MPSVVAELLRNIQHFIPEFACRVSVLPAIDAAPQNLFKVYEHPAKFFHKFHPIDVIKLY